MPDRRALTAREIQTLALIGAAAEGANLRQLAIARCGIAMLRRLVGWGLVRVAGTSRLSTRLHLTPAGRAALGPQTAPQAQP